MKKTISKIIATALTISTVMSSTAVPVSAVESVWGKAPASVSTATSNSKSYNNSSYYTATDKWGNAYPYSYYYYASDYTARTTYEKLYNALYERKSQISLTNAEYTAFDKFSSGVGSVLTDLENNCPHFYYVDDRSISTEGKGDSYRVVVTVTYSLSEKTIAKYEKKFNKVIADFDDYLAEQNVNSTKGFYNCALAYLGSITEYDYDVSRGKKKRGNSDNIIGAFIENEIICQGYVFAFNYLCSTHGISYSYKACDSSKSDAGHAFSLVPYKNVWYNIDPTNYELSEKQYLTDAELKSSGYVTDWRFYKSIPKCNGKVIPTKIALEAPAKVEKADSTVENTTFKDSYFESYAKFKRLYKLDYNAAVRDGMTAIKITMSEDKVDTAVKYLKKIKSEGVYVPYSKLYKGENYVKVVL